MKARVEICILAGGLSSRMGEDKAKMRLGRRTLLGTIRVVAVGTGLPVRVLRRDRVERCGPLGGVYTALKSNRAEALLFLACDMPLITPEFLKQVLSGFGPRTNALFTETEAGAGFPFLLRATALPQVEEQITRKRFSLQALASTLEAKRLRPRRADGKLLLNVNTPADWALAREAFREVVKKRSA